MSEIRKLGSYLLLEKIASGGMADIYLAKKDGAKSTSSFFVIKKILSRYVQTSEYQDMFDEEAKLTSSISMDPHKNVVSLIGYEQIQGEYFLVMEFIKGKNLKSFFRLAHKLKKTLEFPWILNLVHEVAEGLHHLHTLVDVSTGKPLNIVHRDVSPQNIMISHTGQVKIIDFGVSKASILDETQLNKGLKGKVPYMSPEQIQGKKLDHQTDLFSLGVVLWELLSGSRLFLGSSEANTLRNIGKCHIPSLESMCPELPKGIDGLVRKALNKLKSDRYKTALDFAQAIDVFMDKNSCSMKEHDFSQYAKMIYADDYIKVRNKLAQYINLPSTPSVQQFNEVSLSGKTQDPHTNRPSQDIKTNTNIKSSLGSKLNKSLQDDSSFSGSNQQAIAFSNEELMELTDQRYNVSYQSLSKLHMEKQGHDEGMFLDSKKSTKGLLYLLPVLLLGAGLFFANHFSVKEIVLTKIDSNEPYNKRGVATDEGQTFEEASDAYIPEEPVKVVESKFIEIVTIPASAEVRINGGVVKATPFIMTFQRGQKVALEFNKRGYQDLKVDIDASLFFEGSRSLASFLKSGIFIGKERLQVTLQKKRRKRNSIIDR